jgi:hypothetical protein
MRRCMCAVVCLALATTLAAGCGETGPPGGGFTNGPEPADSPQKPAVRTDVLPPDIPNKDDAVGQAGGAAKPAPAPDPDASKKSP